MQNPEQFIHLAEIAGVFVAFGALIAVRSSRPTEPLEVAPMRMMVSMGMLTILAALAPVTLAFFDLAEHQLWALSSAIYLAALLAIVVASARTPEYRAGWAAEMETTRTQRPRWLTVAEAASYVLWVLAVSLTPIVILLGVVPDLEAGLYFAVVALVLLGAGWVLLSLVFAQRLPESA